MILNIEICFFCCDKKLRSIGIGSTIGHGRSPRSLMLQLKVFVFEFFAVNRFATSAVMISEIPSLQHESRNDSMEYRTFIPHTLFATAQSPKILRCSRYNICSQKHDNSADVGVSDLDVKVHLWILLGFLTLQS